MTDGRQSGGSRSLVLLLLAGAVASLLPLAAGSEEEVTERFTANLISMGTVGSGRSTRLEIEITRWSTDEERGKLYEVVRENDPGALIRALRDLDPVGSARLPGRLSYDIRYSREIVEGDKRSIVLATDRPIGAAEARANWRTMENNVSIVNLEVDQEGRGDGTFMAGAELNYDHETGVLEISHLSSEPVRMTNVRRRN